MKVYNRVLASWLPERCQHCGGAAARGLCQACRADLRPVLDPCPRCGLGRPVSRCPRAGEPWSVSTLVAPLRYQDPLDRYVHALKFLSDRRMGRALGLLLADHLRTHDTVASVGALVPVPLHRMRRLERGFNQALEIAWPVASAMQLPVLTAGIHRRVSTRPQARISTHERRANLTGVFHVRRKLDGLTVAIIDDVVTTGATINSLARVLRSAGAAEVHAWAVARAPPSANG